MSQQDKIIDYLGEDKFVVSIKDHDKKSDRSPVGVEVNVNHDFVEIHGSCPFMMESDGKGNYPYKTKDAVSNWVNSKASLQISIREMIKVVLPYLNNHPYLQEDIHLKKRIRDEDDTYFKNYGLDEPRWRKGDTYDPYTYNAGVIIYYDLDKKERMVKFRRKGESVYETVTYGTFIKIRHTLNLYDSKWEIIKQQSE